MKILGIETSCDDTSVALFDNEAGVTENLVSSQVDLHGHFGGVVPELASRAHLVNLLPLVDLLLERRKLRLADLDGVGTAFNVDVYAVGRFQGYGRGLFER